jgi:two-component system NarL family sensor kinase
VTAREEERRRLHRDLHDGLGPALASQGLKIAAVSHLLDRDHQRAQVLLDELASQNEATVAEIRRLVTPTARWKMSMR